MSGTFEDENEDGYASAGESISYEFTIQNSGSTTVTNIVLHSPLFDISGGPLEALAAGANDPSTFSAIYSLTEADIAAGSVSTTATVLGFNQQRKIVQDLSDDPTDFDEDDDGDPDDPTSITFVPRPAPNPAISLLMSAQFNDENGNGFASADESVTFEFAVENTGNVDLKNVTIYSPLLEIQRALKTQPLIAASQRLTFTANYTLKQKDLYLGGISSSATVTAEDSDGHVITDISDDPNIGRDIDVNQNGNPDDPTQLILKFYTPTAIVLTSFTTALNENADGILIRWVTGAEVDVHGFHILRNDIGTANQIQFLTEQMLMSQGPSGGIYEILVPYDPSVDIAIEQMDFWLHEEEVSGTVFYYGPAKSAVESAMIKQFMYLPFLSQ